MPGCVLRAFSSTPKVRKFLAATTLRPSAVYFRGEARSPGKNLLTKKSGFNVEITSSDLGASIKKQGLAATRFLRKHERELRRLHAAKFEAIVLDFGLYDRANDERPWPTYTLPRALVEMAGKYGLIIELSFYGPE
jgi:hypothetical protein